MLSRSWIEPKLGVAKMLLATQSHSYSCVQQEPEVSVHAASLQFTAAFMRRLTSVQHAVLNASGMSSHYCQKNKGKLIETWYL